MNIVRLAALGLVTCGLAVTSSSCFATQLTDAFVANAKPNVEFLDRSSRLALERSPNRLVKSYAQDVAARETIVSNTFVAWWQSNTAAGASAALGAPPRAESDPLDRNALDKVAGDVSHLVDGSLLTGRSVAVERLAPVVVPAAKDALLPSQQADFETLKTLSGRRFDAFYKLTQRNALRQLVALYRDYASQGDDPALRSLSTLQLDKTNDLISRLNALH